VIYLDNGLRGTPLAADPVPETMVEFAGLVWVGDPVGILSSVSQQYNLIERCRNGPGEEVERGCYRTA